MPNRAIDTPQWKAGTNKQAPIVEDYPDFEPGSFTFKGVTRPVYKSGEGPAIIVIHEIPGIYDEVWNFARRLNKEGFTTYLPSLIGSPCSGQLFPDSFLGCFSFIAGVNPLLCR
ncbi:MAG: dienelactone hydrolase family protein [Zhongshania sp.]|nr:dienelactone hydrolase family protein [Zhongshania sp.]